MGRIFSGSGEFVPARWEGSSPGVGSLFTLGVFFAGGEGCSLNGIGAKKDLRIVSFGGGGRGKTLVGQMVLLTVLRSNVSGMEGNSQIVKKRRVRTLDIGGRTSSPLCPSSGPLYRISLISSPRLLCFLSPRHRRVCSFGSGELIPVEGGLLQEQGARSRWVGGLLWEWGACSLYCFSSKKA